MNSVEFQKSQSQFQSKLMDSSFVKIKVPENSNSNSNVNLPSETAAQNSGLDDLENSRNDGILTAGRKPRGLKLVLLCCVGALGFAFLLAFLLTPRSGSGSHPGLGGLEKGEKDSNWTAVFLRDSNNSRINYESSLSHSKHRGNLNPNLETEEDVHESAIWEKVQKIDNETSRGFNRLESQITAQQDEIQKLGKNVGDLEGKITHLQGNSSKEMDSLRKEFKNEISLLKDEMKKLMLNFSSNVSAPPPISITSAPPSSVPQFYQNDNFKGAWFQPSSGWESKCIDMPDYFDNVASSVKLGGHCLFACPGTTCMNKILGINGLLAPKDCMELHPNSYGLEDFKKIRFDNEIRSFRLCRK